MQTIAFISQKGGTGKTTLAINLAIASELSRRPTVIVDLDPQASAKSWHDGRESESPVVISAQASRLPEILNIAKQNGAALSIIDTAPHSESASLAAARAADFVFIPCRPGILDLRAITSSADICALAKARAFAIINAAPPRGVLADEAAEAMAGYGLEVAPIRITQRAAFVHSLTSGQGVMEYESAGKAAEEIQQIYKWTRKLVNK